jgi:hypothetical protein
MPLTITRSSGVEAGLDDAERSVALPELHRARLHQSVLTEDDDIPPDLPAPDRGLGHQDRVFDLTGHEPSANEQARLQRTAGLATVARSRIVPVSVSTAGST